MQPTAHEIVSSFFAAVAPIAEVSIDIIDAWAIAGTNPVAPTTICWCDGSPEPVVS